MDEDAFGEAPRDSSGMQRVKLYRLTPDGHWEEKGTGSVSVEYMEQSGAVGLVIIAENDTRTLLIHRISFEDIYQRQGEDTIITWMDAELETDIALSFQEENGCNNIWDQLLEVQKQGQESLPQSDMAEAAEMPPASDATLEEMIGPHLDPDYGEGRGGSAGAEELPSPELGHLSRIAAMLQDANPFARDRLAEQALSPGYLRQLLDIFHDLEDLEDVAGLHSMFAAVRGLIMLNDTMLLETMVNEDNVMDVVGALEYDPDQAVRQQHREFLRDKVVFREVVPITEPSVRAKIHQTYRVGYLKDVILPRVLDDGTFATLSSLMMFNNVEVLVALTQSATFFPDLFRRLSNGKAAAGATADAEWVDHVSFLQELCGMSKHLQVSNRTQMLNKLITLGLFRVMSAALERPSDSLRLRAMDVLLAAAQHDPQPLRDYIEGSPEQERLMELLIKALSDISQAGLQEQALELLRVLLNIDVLDGPVHHNSFLEMFYLPNTGHMAHLLATLSAGGGANVENGGAPAPTLAVIMELLCFGVARHGMRVKYFIMKHACLEAVLKLMGRREQWLAVAAVRFVRACLAIKDMFWDKFLIRKDSFEPVVSALLANGNRYNLLNSAILEMIDFIRLENNKLLVAHFVEKFGDRLAEVDYVDTFSALRIKYDQAKDKTSGVSSDVTSEAQAALEQERRRPDARAPTRDEEDYFGEGGDDDDEGPPAPAPSPAASAGVPPRPPRAPPLAGLVDYGYDDEDEGDESMLGDESSMSDELSGHRHSPTRSSHSASSLASSGSIKRGPQLLGAAEDEGASKRPRGPDHGRCHSPELLQGRSQPCQVSAMQDSAVAASRAADESRGANGAASRVRDFGPADGPFAFGSKSEGANNFSGSFRSYMPPTSNAGDGDDSLVPSSSRMSSEAAVPQSSTRRSRSPAARGSGSSSRSLSPVARGRSGSNSRSRSPVARGRSSSSSSNSRSLSPAARDSRSNHSDHGRRRGDSGNDSNHGRRRHGSRDDSDPERRSVKRRSDERKRGYSKRASSESGNGERRFSCNREEWDAERGSGRRGSADRPRSNSSHSDRDRESLLYDKPRDSSTRDSSRLWHRPQSLRRSDTGSGDVGYWQSGGRDLAEELSDVGVNPGPWVPAHYISPSNSAPPSSAPQASSVPPANSAPLGDPASPTDAPRSSSQTIPPNRNGSQGGQGPATSSSNHVVVDPPDKINDLSGSQGGQVYATAAGNHVTNVNNAPNHVQHSGNHVTGADNTHNHVQYLGGPEQGPEQGPVTNGGFKSAASIGEGFPKTEAFSIGEGPPLKFQLPSQTRTATATFRRPLKGIGQLRPRNAPDSPRVSSGSD